MNTPEPAAAPVQPQDDDVDPATKAAAIETAVAEAAQAKANAEKAAADARSAVAKADTDEAVAAAGNSALGQQERDALSRQRAAEAEKATVTAKRDQVAALIPNFSDAERGTLAVGADQPPMFADALARRALDSAAGTLGEEVSELLPAGGSCRVLLTSDAQLVDSHATYVNVVTGLDGLTDAAETLLGDLEEASTRELLEPATATIAAVVGALPGLLSLFSAHRTITTGPVTVDDLSAAAATARALIHLKNEIVIVHDDVRMLDTGVVHARVAALGAKRRDLVARKLTLDVERAEANTDLTQARERAKELKKEYDDAPPEAKPARLTDLQEKRDSVRRLENALAQATASAGSIDSLLAAVDAFNASLNAVPEGASRSPLTVAAIREHLNDVPPPQTSTTLAEGVARAVEPDKRFTHVLLVKGSGGSAQQMFDDKPFLFEDKFAVVATANITYLLIATTGSAVLAAGNAGGSAAAHGSVGDEFKFQVTGRGFATGSRDS